MKLSIFDQAIYRVPQFHSNAILIESWDELKESIRLSSSDFYDQIKDTNADGVYNLPQPLFNTVWKYFNRSRFRATPFGSFAGFGLADLNEQTDSHSVTISSSQKLHSFIAWPYKNHVPITMELLLSEGGYLIANDSYYIIMDSIRYLSYIDDKFELSEIEFNATVNKILLACKKKMNASELQGFITPMFSNMEQLNEAINYLISLQLLFTSRHPNIIGEEYFERMDITNTPQHPQYVITERESISCTIRKRAFKDIPELAMRLHQIVTNPNSAPLDKFITDFLKKFERKEVPVMETLDPELGIGYGNLEQSNDQQGHVDFVPKNGEPVTHNENKPLKDFLYKELLKCSTNHNEVVKLENFPILNHAVKKLPNTFNAVLSDADGLLCLESLGGATSNAIVGRFSLASDAITTYCKRVAEIERQANPGVLFFDIGYTAENHVDNINRRRDIYGLQLNLLNYDLSEEPLQISDLLLSVYRGELILRSKRLNKRLVPRLASAYNYGRSDLPLFRLLCDIQSQGIINGLTLNVLYLLPGLTFYPRMQFRNIIVSRAKWRLSFADFQQQIQHSSLNHFKDFLYKESVSRYFKTGFADQTLLFDLENDNDLLLFMEYLKKHKSLIVEEAFVTRDGLIKDGQGRSYSSEWIIGLYHANEIYKETKSTSSIIEDQQLPTVIPPGGEWLYFEIFSHPKRADAILLNSIAILLKKRQNLIRQWFFIRYTENGYHLRLRLRLYNSQKAQQIITELSGLLNEEIQCGIISDFSIRTYKRELARYGSLNMEKVEAHFHVDSTYVLDIVSQSPEAYTLYATCRDMVLYLRNSGVFNIVSFDDLLNRISGSLNEEHHMTPLSFKKLNDAYKTFRTAMPLAMNNHHSLKSLTDSFLSTLDFCLPSARNQLFADLMHMHINRLFSTDQRTHEMIFYYFLTKEMKERNARGIHTSHVLPGIA
jgi:thiopeptide-type bacteriocin biosynthesis protein